MLITGKAYWCKLGTPVANKFKNGAREWSFDLTVDKKTQKELLDAGVKKTIFKNKNDEREVFISFTKSELKQDGSLSKPYQIFDHHQTAWSKEKLIGNGSTLNVAIFLAEREFRGEKFIKPVATKIQVWDHKEFARDEEFPTAEGAPERSGDSPSSENWE